MADQHTPRAKKTTRRRKAAPKIPLDLSRAIRILGEKRGHPPFLRASTLEGCLQQQQVKCRVYLAGPFTAGNKDQFSIVVEGITWDMDGRQYASPEEFVRSQESKGVNFGRDRTPGEWYMEEASRKRFSAYTPEKYPDLAAEISSLLAAREARLIEEATPSTPSRSRARL